MTPLVPLHATRHLATGLDGVSRLIIRDDEINGTNHMTSLWEPTPRELATLLAGGSVRLTIVGDDHPPVIVETEVRKSSE